MWIVGISVKQWYIWMFDVELMTSASGWNYRGKVGKHIAQAS